ncbi:hypothetical protein [Bacillus cereus]|uniref:hypothetical protein n=1 Tax=Bacillus cereus TaxID=1396 RepID=UPI000BFD1F7C|nr:hypothetical protein [Bacillus cereus]PGT18643.1 hypothetical protein COC96_11300 [Bacillus cereus]
MKLKVLATTGLALTLGLTSIGTSVTPTYAAESSSSYQWKWDTTGQRTAHTYKDVYSSNNMFKFASFDTTGFKITSQEKTLKSIDFAINDNSGNPDASTRKAPTKTYSTTDSMTFNASTEVSVGAEMSASAKIPGIAEVTSKITTGFKASAGFSKLSSETKTLSYGGDDLVAKPHQVLRVDYFLEELNTTGTMNTGTRITEIGDNFAFTSVTAIWGPEAYKHRELTVPGHLTGEQVYNQFKSIEELNQTNDIVLRTADQTIVALTLIRKGEFSKHFFIDEVAKTVSTVGTQASFDGVSGTGLTAKTSVIDPATNAKTVIAEEQIQQP